MIDQHKSGGVAMGGQRLQNRRHDGSTEVKGEQLAAVYAENAGSAVASDGNRMFYPHGDYLEIGGLVSDSGCREQ